MSKIENHTVFQGEVVRYIKRCFRDKVIDTETALRSIAEQLIELEAANYRIDLQAASIEELNEHWKRRVKDRGWVEGPGVIDVIIDCFKIESAHKLGIK